MGIADLASSVTGGRVNGCEPSTGLAHFLVLVSFGLLVALAPLGYDSPAVPSWIEGIFEDDDSDDDASAESSKLPPVVIALISDILPPCFALARFGPVESGTMPVPASSVCGARAPPLA